jgi:hypothetical protein
MNEAIKVVNDSYTAKISETEGALTKLKEGQKTQEDAAWKTFMDNLTGIIKDSKWTDVGKAFSDWKAADDKVKSDFKSGIDALTKKVADYKTEQATAVKTVTDTFVKQMEAFKPAAPVSSGSYIVKSW